MIAFYINITQLIKLSFEIICKLSLFSILLEVAFDKTTLRLMLSLTSKIALCEAAYCCNILRAARASLFLYLFAVSPKRLFQPQPLFRLHPAVFVMYALFKYTVYSLVLCALMSH